MTASNPGECHYLNARIDLYHSPSKRVATLTLYPLLALRRSVSLSFDLYSLTLHYQLQYTGTYYHQNRHQLRLRLRPLQTGTHSIHPTTDKTRMAGKPATGPGGSRFTGMPARGESSQALLGAGRKAVSYSCRSWDRVMGLDEDT